MAQIALKDVHFRYPGASAPVLRGVDLEVGKGDFLALVGSNGCGKSTLCKVLNGLIPHFIRGTFSGSAEVCGMDVTKSDVPSMARHVGYVYQDFENQILRPTVLDDASFACFQYAMEDYAGRGRDALAACGLTGMDGAYIWQLSGGQKHLLATAGVLSLAPEVLVLDEPIAQLDPEHADRMYTVLRKLNEELGLTIIVIEHHTEYICQYCKHVALMQDGKVSWMLPTAEALRRVGDLLASKIFPPQVTQAAHRLAQIGRFSAEAAYPLTSEEARRVFRRAQRVLRAPESGVRACRPPAVELRGVRFFYKGMHKECREVFRDLSLDIRRGEAVALVGGNGAGKSTLLKMLCGLLRPQEGDVYLGGEPISDRLPEEIAHRVSLVFQNPEEMFLCDTIAGDVAFGMEARGKRDARERTEMLLERFALGELADRDGRMLSGGQMRRASLAIGVSLDPEILLLDEPTANLDVATRQEIIRVLRDRKQDEETVIIATHDMQLVGEWADRVIALGEGGIVADGTPKEVFGDPKALRRAGIRPPEIYEAAHALDAEAHCFSVDAFVEAFEGMMA